MDKFTQSGIVLVNKPVGISSNKVVNIVKYKLGAKKCGHLGTLDLEGAGLLPVSVNGATKLFDYYLNKTKTYETIFVFGVETDTLDLSGVITKEKECDIAQTDVEEAIKSMIGKYMQLPPQYSAKKVNGKIAYKEARKGETIELAPKEVEIYDFRLIEKLDKNKFKFEISCSSGTYIRCIARDLAEKLSTYGSMQCILRTRCGDFSIKDASSMQEIENGKIRLIPCEELFDFEKVELQKVSAEKLLNGQEIESVLPAGKYRLFDGKAFLGLGQIKDGKLKLVLRLI